MPIMFGNYGPAKTLEEAEKDGYVAGKVASYDEPGGPWVAKNVGVHRDPDCDAYCDHLAEVNRVWLEAWHRGKAEQTKAS